ncbi:MED6-domain-containing protein [Mycena venus]|uniref:MED6-domain-containing protein n=1 Tax=Mycena venus TaxID=2733690 RepID=A0A8H6XGI3_9AGAR|nr:MED6-domain-containing protein [Mycena venus]
MSVPQGTQYPPGTVFDDFTADYNKTLEDLFELELDTSLAGFDDDQLQLLTIDSHDAYSFFRSDTPTRGPPSNITASSESAYDSLSSYSESFYNYPHSPQPPSNYSFPLDLEMDFQRIRVDAATSEYAAAQASSDAAAANRVSFGTSAAPDTTRSTKPYTKAYTSRTTFSDYGPSTRPSVPVDLYSQLNFNNQTLAGPTVSPSHISTQLPTIPAGQMAHVPEEEDYKGGDARKKYKCSRVSARAYNLKTHMATHDPNRLKPHVCPHRSCGRSFSRKHDLGRHLISIHRDESQREESVCSSHHSAGSKKSIGVEQGARRWCDRCGKGLIGLAVDCDCT